LHNYGNQTNPTFTIRLMALQGPDQLDVLTKKGQFLGVMQQGMKAKQTIWIIILFWFDLIHFLWRDYSGRFHDIR